MIHFLQIWVISFIGLALTSVVAILFILITTGVIENMDVNEKGEVRSFSLIVLGSWSVGISLILSQLIILLT